MQTLTELMTIDWMADFVNGYAWVWPICEIFHFVGMALLIGTVGFLDARILGFFKRVPIASLERLVPIGVVGFAFNLITGFIFVSGNPAGGPGAYLENLAFQIKMLLILIAGANLLAYYVTGLARGAGAVPPGGDAPRAAKVVAAVSLLAW